MLMLVSLLLLSPLLLLESLLRLLVRAVPGKSAVADVPSVTLNPAVA